MMDKLLKLLDSDARLTNEQLAVMLGRTEQEVADQISEWERDGTIRGYKAIIDWERTDRAYVTALIELRVTPKRDLGFDGIAETIMRFKEVESVYLMSGGYDLAVIVSGRTFKDIAMFVAKRLSTLDSVISTATHFMLRRYKESGVILLGEEKDERGVL
jgi:DNA-binding Lrp family transcriptional regulator